jgi:hypothetical protein
VPGHFLFPQRQSAFSFEKLLNEKMRRHMSFFLSRAVILYGLLNAWLLLIFDFIFYFLIRAS